MKRYIAVDSGKDSTKAVIRRSGDTPDREMSFLTRMDNLDEDYGLLGSGNTYTVEIDGKTYHVGDNARYDSFAETKTEEIHKLCIYTAVAKLVDNGDEVNLAIGCPLSIYINKEARAEYANYIKGTGFVNITVNGIKHHFVIAKVLVLPESSGIVYDNFEKYMKTTVGVIDIGGLNTNCCIYKNLAPQAQYLFTTRFGSKEMFKSLLDVLNSKLNLTVPIQDYQIRDIVEKGYVPNRKNPEKEALSKRIIHEHRLQHVKDIYNTCVQHSWSLDILDLKFIGGTSLLLKDEIKEVFGVDESSFFADAQFLNAKGYLKALS